MVAWYWLLVAAFCSYSWGWGNGYHDLARWLKRGYVKLEDFDD